MKPGYLGAMLTALLLAGGCQDPGGSPGDPSDPTVQDSAGVRIVENGPAPETRWSVAATPLFTVGWEDAGPLFTWPQSGRILPDGGALVGEFAEGRVYRLTSDGSVAANWGRKGEGPGEYQGLDAILLRADSTLISDGRLRRLTVLSPDGGVATQPLPGSFLHQASTVWRDGRLLLTPGEGYAGVAETRPEWVFESQPILTLSLADGTVDTLADLPHLRRWYGTRGASPGPVTVKGRAGGYANGFAWARSDERSVRWYDDAGRLVQVARWEEDPTPLTSGWRDAMRRAFEEAYASGGANEAFIAAQLARLEEGLDRHDGPLPYWDELHVDRVGNVWLSRYSLPGTPPDRWRVVDREGVYRGWVELPGVVTVLDITEDRILAVRHNELDVPAVQMLELRKGQ